jgi:hypothetical protein
MLRPDEEIHVAGLFWRRIGGLCGFVNPNGRKKNVQREEALHIRECLCDKIL